MRNIESELRYKREFDCRNSKWKICGGKWKKKEEEKRKRSKKKKKRTKIDSIPDGPQ